MNVKDKVGSIFKWTVNAFWPVIVFVLGGGIYFSDSIMASIASTTDPEVVYAIIAVIFVAVGLLFYAMHNYIMELFFLEQVTQDVRQKKQLVLDASAEKSLWFPVYHLMTLDLPWGTVKPVLELEIEKARENFNGLIQFPTYLAGALVGMGLVGTFIGLLATLKDLAEVFALMANIGGGGSDPIRMFGEMIVKLQGPIKGMGTAFVASLYGLMGSLIVGMVVLSVKRFGERVSLNIEHFSEQYLSQKMHGVQAGPATSGSPDAAIGALTQALTHNVEQLNERLVGLSLQLKSYESEVAQIAQAMTKVGTLKLHSERLLVYGALTVLALLLLGAAALCVSVYKQSSVSSVALIDYGNVALEKPASAGKSVASEPVAPVGEPVARKPSPPEQEKSMHTPEQVKKNESAPAVYRKIAKGDTLFAIAKLCGTDVAKLVELNAQYRQNPNQLTIDQTLVVPSAQCANYSPVN